jgi:hypothetical protein
VTSAAATIVFDCYCFQWTMSWKTLLPAILARFGGAGIVIAKLIVALALPWSTSTEHRLIPWEVLGPVRNR